MKAIAPYLIIAVLVCFSIGTVFTIVYKRGQYAAEQAQRDREIASFKEQVEKSDQIAKSLENQLESMKVENEKLNESLKNEIGTHVVYRSCVLPVGGVQLLNRARAGYQSPAAR